MVQKIPAPSKHKVLVLSLQQWKLQDTHINDLFQSKVRVTLVINVRLEGLKDFWHSHPHVKFCQS